MMTARAQALLKPFLVTFLALLLAACNSSTELYGGLSERDANEITAALTDRGIDSSKQSQGKQLFAVQVPKEDFARSVAILHAQGLPRSSFSRMGEIFKKDGMISTPIEERARFLYALSQELENSLSQIDGVVLARVHPVLPERLVPGEPVLPSSCSVLIKHVPGWNAAQYESRIRKLVLAGIPGLADAPEKVSVVFVTAEGLATAPATDQAMAASTGHPDDRRLFGAWQGWLIGVVAVVIGIGGPWAWLRWHGRPGTASKSEAT